jgi:hypothetical protein
MRSAYKAIAILALILILAGIAASVVAISVGASLLSVLDDINIQIDGSHITLPHIDVDGSDVSVGSDGNGIIVRDGNIHVGPKGGGINITYN